MTHIHTGRQTIVRMLIDNGADVNAVDSKNNSVLIFAIREGKHFYIITAPDMRPGGREWI